MTLEEVRSVDVRTVDRDLLVDVTQVHVARSLLDVGEMTEEIWERFVKAAQVYPDGRSEVRWNFGAEME